MGILLKKMKKNMKLGQLYGGIWEELELGSRWIFKYIARADSQTFSKINDLLELQYLHKGFS